MAIGCSFIGAIGGYSISGYWWLLYWWPFVIILLMAIDEYFINVYWCLLMVISGYSNVSHWWLLITILLMVIDGYYMLYYDYLWLFYFKLFFIGYYYLF